MREKHKPLINKVADASKKIFSPSYLKSGPFLFSIALCAIAAAVVVSAGNRRGAVDINIYEAGMVADKDIVADISLSFVDEEATLAMREAAVRQVPAVFVFSNAITRQILIAWDEFYAFTQGLSDRSAEEARLAIEAQYPGHFQNEVISEYLRFFDNGLFHHYGSEALNAIINKGIFSFSREDIANLNPNTAELLYTDSGRRETVQYENIITITGIRYALSNVIRDMDAPDFFKAIAVDILRPFIRENVFFSLTETQRRIDASLNAVPPVTRIIEKGRRIIRRGFVITEMEMKELEALHLSLPGRDARNITGNILLILIVFSLFIILKSRIVIGRQLSDSERYLLASLTGIYIIGAVLLNNVSFGMENFPLSLFIPTPLIIIILAVFLGTQTAVTMALALPLSVFLAGAFDYYSFLIALVSGVTASTALHNAQNRMSLIKAGLLIAAVNCLAVIVILLLQNADLANYPLLLFIAAINGIISGMLTLGFLPPLEHALNAVTTFRLMELSDLNAPILRKLFTMAPGTYSHSLMVANLAEQACQDIGANALLARVGAYYHDIGKMENPDYFVENQTGDNKHDDTPPRLSATIVRSHVKLGVEKAYSLGLPSDVISIISEHHGNSLISWFYNKAVEQEKDVSSEDFIYPGTPPHSKESAVVMLADITEAAVRTLEKPTPGKMDKFIQQLFESKMEHGQLSESDLSFRELEVIKKAFVKVLAAYYHSRIEYPNQKEEKKAEKSE